MKNFTKATILSVAFLLIPASVCASQARTLTVAERARAIEAANAANATTTTTATANTATTTTATNTRFPGRGQTTGRRAEATTASTAGRQLAQLLRPVSWVATPATWTVGRALETVQLVDGAAIDLTRQAAVPAARIIEVGLGGASIYALHRIGFWAAAARYGTQAVLGLFNGTRGAITTTGNVLDAAGDKAIKTVSSSKKLVGAAAIGVLGYLAWKACKYVRAQAALEAARAEREARA